MLMFKRSAAHGIADPAALWVSELKLALEVPAYC